MNLMPAALQRLQFLSRVVRKESRQLSETDQRLFALPFSEEHVRLLESDPEQGERVEAFVSRFGRLQDTLGDKLLPQLLGALGETPSVMIDNLDKAERFGYIGSADEWIARCARSGTRWSMNTSRTRLFSPMPCRPATGT